MSLTFKDTATHIEVWLDGRHGKDNRLATVYTKTLQGLILTGRKVICIDDSEI